MTLNALPSVHVTAIVWLPFTPGSADAVGVHSNDVASVTSAVTTINLFMAIPLGALIAIITDRIS